MVHGCGATPETATLGFRAQTALRHGHIFARHSEGCETSIGQKVPTEANSKSGLEHSESARVHIKPADRRCYSFPRTNP